MENLLQFSFVLKASVKIFPETESAKANYYTYTSHAIKYG